MYHMGWSKFHGRPMEIEAIIGEPLRRGRELGVDMLETQRLYDELIKIDGRLNV